VKKQAIAAFRNAAVQYGATLFTNEVVSKVNAEQNQVTLTLSEKQITGK